MPNEPMEHPAEYTRPQLACRFWEPFLDLLQERQGVAWVEDLCQEAGLPAAFVRDPDNWISALYARRLADGVARRLHPDLVPRGNDHPAWQVFREAGWLAFDRVYMGPVFYAARALGSPVGIFKMLPELGKRGNLIMRAELVESSPVRAVARYVPCAAQHEDHIAFCWNRQGVMEAIPTLWGLPRAKVRHTRCCHSAEDPSPYCEYEVLFTSPTLQGFRHPALAGTGASLAAVWISQLLGASPAAMALAGVAGGAVAVSAVLTWAFRRLNLERRLEHQSFTEVVVTADERYHALWNEERALRRALLANRKIAGYLAADVVERILENPEQELQLGGVLTQAAVVFADIVGFTSRCEKKSPEVVVEELNLFFGYMDREIEAAQGVVDKRLGDGLMVVFVARGANDTHDVVRRRAVLCARGMMRALELCNQDLASRGAEPIRIRVGIASGSLVQGNIGSPLKLEYTVIGDVVNLASRLEGQARPNQLAVDASVYAAAADLMGAVEWDDVIVKGKQQPIRIYRTVDDPHPS